MKAITTIAQRLRRTEEDVREFYEERAAIREYCGGQSRASAERAALIDCSGMASK